MFLFSSRAATAGRFRHAAGGAAGLPALPPPLHSHHEYLNVLPEEARLAEVTSNFWGTKFRLIAHDLALLPPTLGEVVYKASLLHLQPRQMRLELVDLRDDEEEEGEAADPFNGADSDEDEAFVQESADGSNVVTMRDNILRASVDTPDFEARRKKILAVEDEGDLLKKSEQLKDEDDDDDDGEKAKNVAPIAPLPTRLSFCLSGSMTSSLRGPSASTPLSSAEASTLEGILRQDQQSPASTEASSASPKPSPSLRKSPVKTVAQQAIARAEGQLPEAAAAAPEQLSANVMSESVISCPGGPEAATAAGYGTSPSRRGATAANNPVNSSPSSNLKQQLRMSVSCDNYLSEAKFGLSRRDSVGSGSPHSSRGSPRRWAAKVDELVAEAATSAAVVEGGGDVASLARIASPVRHDAEAAVGRSSSATDLDVIVDLLGVPSDLLSQRTDLNKRLVLMKEEREKLKLLEDDEESSSNNSGEKDEGLGHAIEARIATGKACAAPGLERCGKSRSCDDSESRDQRRPQQQRTKREAIELKRRSVYSKEHCKGRTEDKSCLNCEAVAKTANDHELNKEIFDVERVTEEDVAVAEDEEPDEEPEQLEGDRQPLLQPIRENIPCKAGAQTTAHHPVPPAAAASSSQSPRPPRRFDSVRSLLEKVRSSLLKTNLPASSASASSRPAAGSDELRLEVQASPRLGRLRRPFLR